jgi:YD repeat-containing protein
MSTPVYNQTPTVKYRPLARKDANSNIITTSFSDQAFYGVYDDSNNLIYKAFARPGTSSSATGWQIAKLTYDGSNNLLTITWPQDTNSNASNDYEFIASSYLSYTYS